MTGDDRETMIRDRAYLIWVEEGRPEGRADDHWREATEAVDAEEAAVTPIHDIGADPAPLLPVNR